jgi:hypothetical protein
MLQGSGPREVLDYWGGGFFDILEFTMQSTLMLVTGFALANTPPVHRALRAFARLPRNEVQILVLTVLVMMVFSWISWGFGLIAGAIVAREMGIVHRGRSTIRLSSQEPTLASSCGTPGMGAPFPSSSPPRDTSSKNRWVSFPSQRRSSRRSP